MSGKNQFASHKWTRLSLRNNRLNFKTLEKILIILEEFIEFISMKKNQLDMVN